MATHRVIELAKVITDCTAAVNQHLTDNGFQTPTLDASAPARLPIDPAAIHVEHARQAVVEAADELSALMRGPAELLRVGVRCHLPHCVLSAFPTRLVFSPFACRIGSGNHSADSTLTHY